MRMGMTMLLMLAIIGLFYGVLIYIIILVIKALRKYIKTADVRKEKSEVKKSLGETIRDTGLTAK